MHPRRKPAHQSVSLCQSKKRPVSSLQKEYTGEEDMLDASTTTPDFERNKSSDETSNADHWFEKSNKHPKLIHTSYRDDDPPFEPDMSTPSADPQPYAHMMPMPSALQSTGSSSEEYRGVIDDLTVQIKKLRKKLKKYERLQDHRLDEEKRVEVKTYGLRSEKKRELEALLSKFTSSLDESSPRIAVAASSSALISGTSGARPSSSLTSYAANGSVPKLKPSDSVSTAVFADSGYGSLAHSGGKRSVSTSATDVARRPSQQVAVAQARDQQIESYLQDMSAGLGLLPRPALTMGDKAKKQLIVMRLEQILGGREAEAGVHHQSLQQEEVSRSAAHAERSAMEALGQRHKPEGVREALIMPDTEDQDMTIADYQPDPTSKNGTIVERDFATNSETSRFEQRPTRPLDLDPDRAQNASENVQYLRHLGFTLENRDMLTANSDSQGWIYLNLMIGLAQLHSYNVTTSFVREAIARYSKKFELSRDGRKVRWRSYGARPYNEGTAPLIDPATGVPAPEVRRRSFAAIEPEPKLAQHIYTPLFPQKQESMSEEGSDSVEELSTMPQTGHSGDLISALASGSNPVIAQQSDAPMIFYNQARFYTDLSADPAMSTLGQNRVVYTGNQCPLGDKPFLRYGRRESRQPSARALIHTIIPEEAEPIDEEVEVKLDFPQHSPRRVAFIEDDIIALEASGLGGVYPEDHFSLSVRCQHNLNASTSTTAKPSSFPNRLFHFDPSPRKMSIYRNKILSTKRTNLPPSELPEPSFGFANDDSDSGSESDESDHSVSHDVASTTDMPRLVSTSAFGPTNHYDRGYSSSPADTDAPSTPVQSASHHAHADEDEAYSSTSSSSHTSHDSTASQHAHAVHRHTSADARSAAIDFLAHARAVNPKAIMAMERRYDADVADRLAEEIPAGSSAATAGGGSGWGSPVGAGKAIDALEGEGAESDEEVECGSVSS